MHLPHDKIKADYTCLSLNIQKTIAKLFLPLLSKSLEAKMRKRKAIARLLTSISCLLPGILLVFTAAFPPARLTAQDETEALRREIRVLNLVNGLELSLEQMQLILERATESQRLLQEARLNYISRQSELDRLLEEIKRYRLDDKDVPPELAQRFHSLDTELKKERARIQEALQFLARDIEKSLKPHQIYALDNYVPCVIPPKGEGRIGQAVDVKGISNRLARLRSVPDRVYDRRKRQILERTLEEIKLRSGPAFNEETEEEVAAGIRNFYDRLRDLSEVDFEVQKENLAKEFASLIKPKSRPLNLTRKIEAFLLSPEIIPILDAKIQEAQSKD